MKKKSLEALALYEIGLNLIIGDIPTDLADLLTESESKSITEMRAKIGQEFIKKSGLESSSVDWNEIVNLLNDT